MMKRVLMLTAVASLLMVPSSDAQGWYVGLLGGYSETDDTKFGTALGTVTTTYDSGTFYALNVGYGTGKVRVEGEIGTRDGDVQDHILGGDKLPGPTGEITSTSLMANVLYDFNRAGKVQPYIGFGLGYADVEKDSFGVAPIPDVLDDDDSSLAYQLLIGVGFSLAENWDLTLDYRWFATDSLTFTVSEPAGSVSSDVDYQVQDIVIGVRYSF